MNHSTAGPLEPHPSTDGQDSEASPHGVPHVCNNGWVSIAQEVLDPETGEETEEYALYLCRRCASEASRYL